MIYAVIQTIQLLGRRIIVKINYLAATLIFSGLFQIIPIMFVLPMIRVIANPRKQSEGLPRRMKALLPEDLANTLDNFIATTETKMLIVSIVGLALVLFGIQALLTRNIKKYTIGFLNQQSNILAHKLFNNYLEADVFSYANPMDKINSGCNALSTVLNETIMVIFGISMFFLIALILIYIYPLPGLASVLVTVTTLSLLAFVIQPKMDFIINKSQLALHRGESALKDSMKAIKEIKLMGRERFFFNAYIEKQINEQDQKELMDKFKSVQIIVNMIMRYLGLIVGMVLAIYTLPKEDLAGFAMIFILLLSRVNAYAGKIIHGSELIYNSLLVLQSNYKTLLKYSEKSTNLDDTPIVCKEAVEFKHLSFRHSNAQDDPEEDYETAALVQQNEEEKEEKELPFVLNNLNFKMRQGQFVGLVGRNGSGKSTILDLFSGLLIPTKGNILVDGQKLRVSDRKNWRKQINYIIQKPHMISESILYNVTLGLKEEEIDQQLLKRALKLSMLNQVIEQLPEGLETNVGIMGNKISGGQAQRIALARAIYQDRPVLLLDEATRAIDAATEAEIMEKISVMRGKKTVIIVTHRVQSLRQCDKIFVLDDKNIVAEGDYETLCETSELFRLFALGQRQLDKQKQKEIPSVA